MSGIDFDPGVVHEHATHLYDDAQRIVANWTLMGTLMGLVIGMAASGPLSLTTLVVAVFTTGMGYVVGTDRARQMRFEAQLALLQVKIEQNTRSQLVESRLGSRKLIDAVDALMDAPSPKAPPAADPTDAPAPRKLPPGPAPMPRHDDPQTSSNQPENSAASDEDDEESAYQDLVWRGTDAEVPEARPVREAPETFVEDEEEEEQA